MLERSVRFGTARGVYGTPPRAGTPRAGAPRRALRSNLSARGNEIAVTEDRIAPPDAPALGEDRTSYEAEARRLEALARYRVLDTPPERAFDDLALLASRICETPIALVSLVDETRQWFKARVGLEARETARSMAFCAHAIRGSELFVVPDAAQDPRFSDNPLVTGPPHIRFYAGSPLVTPDGWALGTICAIDRVPRSLSPEHREALQALARQVVAQLELRSRFSELQAALAERTASEAMRTALIENMLGGLVVVDSEGIIRSVNASAERMFGWRREELEGRFAGVLFGTRDAGQDARLLSRIRGRALGRVTEWPARRRSGEAFPVEVALFSFEGPEGRMYGGNLRDVSERHEMERLKDEFVSTVSHELRTPLTAVRGSLRLLGQGVLGPLSKEAAEVVAVAERNTFRLIAIINDILDLERLRHGSIAMRIEDLPLSELLRRALDTVAPLAAEQDIRILCSETPLAARADGDRVVQVLVNLLSNAVKFSPRGSEVVVDALSEGPDVLVRVSDRGRGVPPRHQQTIFERFRQVEASDARQKGGTGLGLAICKSIVEQLGGTIGVTSEEGRGSVFWFRVPAARVNGVTR